MAIRSIVAGCGAYLPSRIVTNAELARKIEEVIMWQPGKEKGSALEGTPDDPRFKYIKYD